MSGPVATNRIEDDVARRARQKAMMITVTGDGDGNLDELAALAWDGARCIVRVVGEYGRGLWLSHADSVVAFRGEVDGCLVGLAEAVVRLRDLSARWDDPLEARRYFGSDYMLHFASGSVVTLGNPAKLNITGDVTLVARVRFSSIAGANRIISWNNSATVYPYLWAIAGTTQVVFQHSGEKGVVGAINGLAANRWYTLAVVVSGSSVAFYRWDEDEQSSGAVKEEFTLSAARAAGNGNLRIGQSGGASSPGMQLDELRVWSVVKTEAELDALRRRAPATAAGSSPRGVRPPRRRAHRARRATQIDHRSGRSPRNARKLGAGRHPLAVLNPQATRAPGRHNPP